MLLHANTYTYIHMYKNIHAHTVIESDDGKTEQSILFSVHLNTHKKGQRYDTKK